MKIFGRYILSPIYIKWFGNLGLWTDPLNYTIHLKIGPYALRIPTIQRMTGTCDTTTLIIQFVKYILNKETNRWQDGKVKECSLTWRPDVTWQNFDSESYFAYKRRRFIKKYGGLPKVSNGA